jgi:hypothetical protein
MGQALDVLAGDFSGTDTWWDPTMNDNGDVVGPQTDGTYQFPTEAQPNNQPWDTSGGQPGMYGSDVLQVLTAGINAWSSNKARSDFIDYNRVESTNGGTFRQGQPANIAPRMTATQTGTASGAPSAGIKISPIMIGLGVLVLIALVK